MADYLKDRDIEEKIKQIGNIQNAIDNPMFDLNQHQSIEVDIRINENLKHASFVPDKEIPNRWYTTSQTFKAMKKNIFALTEDFEDLAQIINCPSCHTELDKQFWHFCPHCGGSFNS